VKTVKAWVIRNDNGEYVGIGITRKWCEELIAQAIQAWDGGKLEVVRVEIREVNAKRARRK
jgi:hypothetical protein